MPSNVRQTKIFLCYEKNKFLDVIITSFNDTKWYNYKLIYIYIYLYMYVCMYVYTGIGDTDAIIYDNTYTLTNK